MLNRGRRQQRQISGRRDTCVQRGARIRVGCAERHIQVDAIRLWSFILAMILRWLPSKAAAATFLALFIVSACLTRKIDSLSILAYLLPGSQIVFKVWQVRDNHEAIFHLAYMASSSVAMTDQAALPYSHRNHTIFLHSLLVALIYPSGAPYHIRIL